MCVPYCVCAWRRGCKILVVTKAIFFVSIWVDCGYCSTHTHTLLDNCVRTNCNCCTRDTTVGYPLRIHSRKRVVHIWGSLHCTARLRLLHACGTRAVRAAGIQHPLPIYGAWYHLPLQRDTSWVHFPLSRDPVTGCAGPFFSKLLRGKKNADYISTVHWYEKVAGHFLTPTPNL